jgi:hypothetical protein
MAKKPIAAHVCAGSAAVPEDQDVTVLSSVVWVAVLMTCQLPDPESANSPTQAVSPLVLAEDRLTVTVVSPPVATLYPTYVETLVEECETSAVNPAGGVMVPADLSRPAANQIRFPAVAPLDRVAETLVEDAADVPDAA